MRSSSRIDMRALLGTKFGALLLGVLLLPSCTQDRSIELNSFLEWQSCEDSITYILPSVKEMAHIDTNDAYGPFCSVKVRLCYPVSVNKRTDEVADSLRRFIYRTVLGLQNDGEETPEQMLALYQKQRIDTYIDNRADLTQAIFEDGQFISLYTSSSTLDSELIYDRQNIISYGVESWSYEGGAHGLYGTTFYNYDLWNNCRLTTEMFFNMSEADAISKLIVNGLVKTFEVEDTDELEAIGIYNVEEVSVTDNFTFTPDGVKFLYNPYEIAPYVVGIIEVVLPYNVIEPYVREEYKFILSND